MTTDSDDTALALAALRLLWHYVNRDEPRLQQAWEAAAASFGAQPVALGCLSVADALLQSLSRRADLSPLQVLELTAVDLFGAEIDLTAE